jgi:quercetin dioxygenase-like cupin family protein
MRGRPALLLLVVAAACGPRLPRVTYGLLSEGVAPFVASHPIPGDQELRVDEIGRTPSASYHLAQVRGAERPHRHMRHDLTVAVLRGRGELALGDQRVALAAGDVAVVPRGVVHWFRNTGQGSALALITITPAADEPDVEPPER